MIETKGTFNFRRWSIVTAKFIALLPVTVTCENLRAGGKEKEPKFVLHKKYVIYDRNPILLGIDAI